MRQFKRLLISTGALALSLSGAAVATPADMMRLPKLDEKQLGHINRIVALANQADGDWSSMGGFEPGQSGYDGYRFQLAFMSYALSVANYQYTPAYRDLTRDADMKLIKKMLRPESWNYWYVAGRLNDSYELESSGLLFLDPVADQNIMYSGHLLQMVTTHKALYGDDRFDRDGAIEFKELGKTQATYNTAKLAKVIFDQFKATGWKGVACEPYTIYVECISHPILGFALFDRDAGTNYYPEVVEGLKKQMVALNYVNPSTQSYMARYKIKTNTTVTEPYGVDAYNDAWAGTLVHGWYKEEAERLYPTQRERHTVALGDGTMTIKTVPQSLEPDSLYRGYSYDHGLFAAYAAEIGDKPTRDALLAYADKYWSPQWKGDQYFISRNDAFKNPGDGDNVWRRVAAFTANGLLAFAAINNGSGLYNLYNRPPDPARAKDPYVTDVKFPSVQVTRAVYDGAEKALIVTLRPGAAHRNADAAVSWTVKNLKQKTRYGIWIDGEKVGQVGDGEARVDPSRGLSVSVESDGLRMTHSLAREQSFVIAQE